MGIFNWLSDVFGDSSSATSSVDDNAINPANGLPMVDGTGGVDVEGNPYGTDSSHDLMDSSMNDSLGTSSFDDSFGCGVDDSFSSGIDDTFSSGGFDEW
ncbi:hypothetical protein [Paraferrimonas sedimenticola]|uniref:Uncharacterized protein n=1 Tax=Paraferrimonas sedimenticola TaxID=375674 RepID=A0AA37VSK4_9GAMM|nr:hypothetical protein [Paraferrimonas sedimenticola]GLP94706.1 hypothetical protein GCM10007895_00120 [Paraferrimonas sedimenticola]